MGLIDMKPRQIRFYESLQRTAQLNAARLLDWARRADCLKGDVWFIVRILSLTIQLEGK